MDYEKLYKEALERAREKYAMFEGMNTGDVLEDVFPELCESEDEKIRKELIRETKGSEVRLFEIVTNNEFVSWLEKQGEQKPFDYENANIQQEDFAPKEVIPRYIIGDVLCDKSCTTLSKEEQSNFEIFDIRNGMYICDKGSFPISQQDEYELVAKRIEQKPAEWNVDDKSIISDLLDYFGEDKCLKHEVNDVVKWLKTIKPQQQIWSENEIKMLDNLTTYLDGRKDLLEEIKSTYISWLKSLKGRVQPKKEWSEDDEGFFNDVIAFLEDARDCRQNALDCIDWLNSLKQRIGG